jgi:hypothetical protein
MKWIIAGIVLLVWAGVNGAYKLGAASVAPWLLSFFVWVFVGALLLLRSAARFIRR